MARDALVVAQLSDLHCGSPHFDAHLLETAPERAAMIGDSPTDDVDGARALGLRAFLLDRESRFPDRDDALRDLRALPAALGLSGG